MRFWQGGQLSVLLWLFIFLAGAHILIQRHQRLRKLAIPDALIAGTVGLALGTSALGWIKLDTHTLQMVVYHGLGLVFVAMGLRAPGPRGESLGARAITFALPTVIALQATLGLLLCLTVSALGTPIHRGVGLLLPLGFSQGPGQALALGAVWEESYGVTDGAQFGLMFAAIGYASCCVLGVALFHLGRHRGWIDTETTRQGSVQDATVKPEQAIAISKKAITILGQLTLIGGLYLASFGLVHALTEGLRHHGREVEMIWGYHYLFGLGLATAVRRLLKNHPARTAIKDEYLASLGGIAVDFSAAAAIAAIQTDLVAQYWAILLLFGGSASVGTFLFCLWTARRTFPDRPFSHLLVFFGSMTGTLPTGLSLLRLADPQLHGPAARNMVMGVTGALLPAIPVIVIFMPLIVKHPAQLPMLTMGLMLYVLLLFALWYRYGALRFMRPLRELWPRENHPLAQVD